MTDIRAIVAAMTPEEQRVAWRVLDAVSRPMTAREIEGVLRTNRVSRSRATILAGVLKGWHVVALVGPEP